ncbi:hypothetical protein KIW84_043550, partial [Lathyrus oleraceus]
NTKRAFIISLVQFIYYKYPSYEVKPQLWYFNMTTSKVLSVFFFVLLGLGICSAARTLLTFGVDHGIGGGYHGDIGVSGGGGYGGGAGGGEGGGHGGYHP